MSAEYDDAAAIGKRYRRQDEIGTPWALTIDEQTLADGTVTLRDRDTLAAGADSARRRQAAAARQARAALAAARLTWRGADASPRARCAGTRSAIRTNATLWVRAPADRSRALPDRVRAARAHALGGVVVQRRAVRAVVSGGDRRTRARKPSSSSSTAGRRSAARSGSTRRASDATAPTCGTRSSRSSTRRTRRTACAALQGKSSGGYGAIVNTLDAARSVPAPSPRTRPTRCSSVTLAHGFPAAARALASAASAR